MATMVLYFLLLTINFGRNLAESNDAEINDVYITEFSSSYYDIPETCSLINSEMPLHNLYKGEFWVSAKIELKRSVNPLGVVRNCESINAGRNLDECIKHCGSKSYFKHGPETCICTDENKIDEGVSSTQPCEIADMGMCSKGSTGCVLYQQGKMPSQGRNISWYDAFQLCKDIGDDLMQETITTNDQLKDGSMFWIGYFVRTVFIWGKENNPTLCVAATLPANGKLPLTSKFCTEKLNSLCTKNSSSHLDCCWLASVIILVVAIIKRRTTTSDIRN